MNSNVEKIAFASTWVLALGYPVLAGLMLVALGLFGSGSTLARACIVLFVLNLFATLLAPFIYSLFGIWIERIHFRALDREEREFSDMIVSDMKTLPPNWRVSETFFVCENVVVSNDYLKRLFWNFRSLFGGRSNSFTRLLERARREATLRMMRKAQGFGANVVWNVRLETTVIQSGDAHSGRMGAGVEVLAYGTAFRVE